VIELSDQELAAAQVQLAARPERRTRQNSWEPISFTPAAPNRIVAIASGKGGVGKSTITANLGVLARHAGLNVGVLDADLHGFSMPRLLGVTAKPAKVGAHIIPPTAHGVKVISVGMFTEQGNAVVWRGPVAHRALTQFLADTDWGALDLLLVDLPPGTGDVALSIANLLPTAELLIVTSPQTAAAEVAARAGTMAAHTSQKVLGVVENMSWLAAPDGSQIALFGSGGGSQVAAQLTEKLNYPVPLLAQIPLDPSIPSSADHGQPIVIVEPNSPVAAALTDLFTKISAPR